MQKEFYYMKNLSLPVIFVLLFVACHKKAIPTKTTNATVVHPTKKETLPPPAKKVSEPEIKPDTAVATPPPVVLPAAMIVIDGYGKILTPQDKLPDQNIKPDYSQIARAFTPQEIANLRTRYKTVPPKILYVPDQYAQKSYRGTYAVYKKKFWYWKKDDGLFYLDEIYYK